jgi:cellulose synthase/poly-beta-1,6-N-acetylglucosamine synthase-like glycosyltransferase
VVTVIIPAHNAETTLERCLAALSAQTRPPDEIIVVDDGSTDGTADVAIDYDVQVLRQARAGPAAARNAGVRVARGELLLFTDADCAPTPDWVDRMVAPFADPTVAGAKGIYRTTQVEPVARFVQIEYEDRYDRMRDQEQIDFVDTYSAGYRRDVLSSVGGFDESFAYLEDQELSFRLAERGYRFMFVPDAAVYHRHADNLLWYARKKYVIGQWKASVARRHPSKLARDSHTPQNLKLQMGLAGAGGVVLVLGAFMRRSRLARWGLGFWAVFGLTTLPFVRKAWRKDRTIALLAPLLLFVRAWALGVGFLMGNLRWLKPMHRVSQRE